MLQNSYKEKIKRIYKLFIEKYTSNEYSFGYLVINNILEHDKSILVCKYKEFLVSNDAHEFLRRFYKHCETKKRLKAIISFYSDNMKIFPNYISIPENKYLYRNIKKKQYFLDHQNEFEKEEFEQIKFHKENGKGKLIIKTNQLFTKDVINDIQNYEMKNNDRDDSFFSTLSNLSKKKNLKKGNNSISKDNSKYDYENETRQSIENILSILNDTKINVSDLRKNYIVDSKSKSKLSKNITKKNNNNNIFTQKKNKNMIKYNSPKSKDVKKMINKSNGFNVFTNFKKNVVPKIQRMKNRTSLILNDTSKITNMSKASFNQTFKTPKTINGQGKIKVNNFNKLDFKNNEIIKEIERNCNNNKNKKILTLENESLKNKKITQFSRINTFNTLSERNLKKKCLINTETKLLIEKNTLENGLITIERDNILICKTENDSIPKHRKNLSGKLHMNNIKPQEQLINEKLLKKKYKTKPNELFNSISSLNSFKNNKQFLNYTGKKNNNIINKKLFNNINSYDSNLKYSHSFKYVGYKDNESTKTSDKNFFANITEREKSNNSEKKPIIKFQNNFNTTSHLKKTTPKINPKFPNKQQTIKVNRNNFLQKIREKTEANLIKKKINEISNDKLSDLSKNLSN